MNKKLITLNQKLIGALFLTLFLLASSALGDEVFPIYTTTVFNAQSVSASGNATSGKVDFNTYGGRGFVSLQITVTGDGTLTLEYLLSNNGTDYIEPATASDIVTGFTKTSGPGSDGKEIYSIKPMVARYIKIKATETGGADAAVITAVLCVQ